jgi:hypothetical protein
MQLCGRQKLVQRKMVLLLVSNSDSPLTTGLTLQQRRRSLWQDISAERVYTGVRATPSHPKPELMNLDFSRLSSKKSTKIRMKIQLID